VEMVGRPIAVEMLGHPIMEVMLGHPLEDPTLGHPRAVIMDPKYFSSQIWHPAETGLLLLHHGKNINCLTADNFA